jgi:hypothetical protein
VVDGFYLKIELRGVAFAVTIAVISYTVTGYDTYDAYFCSSFIPLTIGVIFAYALPLYRTYVQPAAKSGPSRVSNLKELLTFEEGYRSFLEFVRLEFSAENLVFYTVVESYRDQAGARDRTVSRANMAVLPASVKAYEALSHIAGSDESLPEVANQIQDEESRAAIKEAATFIYNKFISEDAAMQVNLPEYVRIPLRQLFAKPPITITDDQLPCVFDEAQKEIFRLMENDTFTRYKRSELFSKLTAQMEQADVKVKIFGLNTEAPEIKDVTL